MFVFAKVVLCGVRSFGHTVINRNSIISLVQPSGYLRSGLPPPDLVRTFLPGAVYVFFLSRGLASP